MASDVGCEGDDSDQSKPVFAGFALAIRVKDTHQAERFSRVCPLAEGCRFR